jgi:hypothetical protein
VDRAVEMGAAENSLSERVNEVCALFGADRPSRLGPEGEAFLAGLLVSASECGGGYLEAIQSLAPELAEQGVKWLQGNVDDVCGRAEAALRTDEQGGPAADASA